MASPLKEFGKTVQRLSRNPLGIIALFIVLIYGIAGLVFGISSQTLEPSERLPLVWFLILFPFAVLIVFYLLVTRHHAKLYAPQDFPESEGFFRAMTPSEQKERLDQEIRALESDSLASDDATTVAVEMEGSGIIHGLSVRHAWVLAEEFAFREIENEFGVPVQRQVAVGSAYGLDGILIHKGKFVVVEIKYIRRRPWREMVQRGVQTLSRAAETLKPVKKFILVIVADDITPERRETELERTQDILNSSSLPIELRVFDFGELKEKYGVAGGST